MQERDVIQGAANGETQLETSTRLWRPPEQVKAEREEAMRKLEARSIAHAVAQAFRRGQIF
jgi:DNA-binding CsgD family transcriptional regulator